MRSVTKHVASHAGKGRQTLALPPPEPTQRVTYHPYSAPLHRIKTDNMLPMQLLTPFQARLPSVTPHREFRRCLVADCF